MTRAKTKVRRSWSFFFLYPLWLWVSFAILWYLLPWSECCKPASVIVVIIVVTIIETIYVAEKDFCTESSIPVILLVFIDSFDYILGTLVVIIDFRR